ncbi:PREDICTED: alpha-ketoglutarate-dependent dioxygenase alkB homolog 4 [Gavialis gangeticus]|uniref:alpha-ketoglutarate-dependent dioxygenase alkB homolog 4 n=1 Tax=Gavialis gangeticus TaxID=94835 RepID=UPI00092FD63C|nr:PREDICTED: alpha-ketoglutarate-dependent dioxygenase alkB homolog 4 [Gavialis gangeticus]
MPPARGSPAQPSLAPRSAAGSLRPGPGVLHRPSLGCWRDGETFTYRPAGGLAVGDPHSAAAGWAFPFPGVLLLEDFLSRAEEAELVRAMDQDPWKPSQSGRRKQDYGPKVNFKKQKLRAGCFVGLPSFSQDIVKRMKAHPILEGFLPVEQCNLDYLPERGSAIDPHFDDWWLWGERLVSLNLLSKTVLSMSCDSENSIQLFATPSQESEKPDQTGSPQTSQNCKNNNFIPTSACENSDNWDLDHTTPTKLVPCKEVTVAVHLPRRSLVVLYGAARYKWKHAIHRKHIEHRRVCITFRELSTEFSLGGKHEKLGKELLDIALSFQGKPV